MPEAIEKVFAAIAGNSNAVNFLEATSAPAVTDDVSKGFSTSSVWFKKTTSQWYTCSDATVGAAVWDELTSGGGHPAFPTDGLIALFHNPAETYDSENAEWSAANDGDLKFVPSSYGPQYDPVYDSETNRLTGTPYQLLNAALAAALSNLDEVTLVIAAKITGGQATVKFGTSPATAYLTNGSSVADAKRNNTNAYRVGLTLIDSTLKVSRVWVGSGTKLRMQAGSAEALESDDSVGVGTTGTVSAAEASSVVAFAGATGTEICYVALYSKFLSDEEWAAVRGSTSDNALYGCAGVTL